MSEDLIVKDNDTVVLPKCTDEEISNAIKFAGDKTKEINELTSQLIVAQNAAKEALKDVESAKVKAKDATKHVNDLKKVGFFSSRRSAINDLQDATKFMSDAQSILSESQLKLA